MQAVEFQSSPDRYIISLNKHIIDRETILKVVEWLQVEQSAQNAAIDDSVIELADEIKAGWWQQNRNRCLHKDL